MNKKQIEAARAALASYYSQSAGQSVLNCYARGEVQTATVSAEDIYAERIRKARELGEKLVAEGLFDA